MMPHRTASAAIDEGAALIVARFTHCHLYADPFRFALSLSHRAAFRDVALNSPSLDIGVNDGSTASVVHHGKARISWGGDMPEERTHESQGLFVSPEFNVYNDLIGMDVCEIPFADDSFNTIVATDVFFYGMDRRRLLSELVRVLAPGGTLAFSDSATGILRYPGLSARLRQEITAFNVPDDPELYYREVLSDLGAEALSARLHFGGALAAMTQSVMYDWPPDASRRRYCDLIRMDPAFRAIHRDRLSGIATLTKAEWERERGPEDGWNIHVSCRKPGLLDLHRPVPSPRCVWCDAVDIERTLETCRCASCGHRYTSRFGRAYLMKGNDAGYCPKPADRYAPGWDERLQARITRALDALCRESDLWLRSDATMTLVGVDPSTEFTVRYLRSRGGPHVDAVCSVEDACAGQSIAGLPIIGGAELGQRKNAVLLSGLGSKAHGALAVRLRERGFSGRVLAIDDGRIREYDEGASRQDSPRLQLTT